jgi:hypothetical protein
MLNPNQRAIIAFLTFWTAMLLGVVVVVFLVGFVLGSILYKIWEAVT